MNDGIGDLLGEREAVPAALEPQTPGSLLRAARERAGLHVAALAVAMKIPVKKLEALEADQLQATHDIVFTRALASSVCRALKIDPKPILDALPQSVVKELHVDDNGINAPFASGSMGSTPSMVEAVRQPWVITVFALVVGALVILGMGWWERSDGSSGQPVQAVVEEPTAPQITVPVVIPPAAPTDVSKMEVPSAAVSPAVTVGSEGAKMPTLAGDAKPEQEAILSKSAAVAASKPLSGVPGSELVMSFRAKHQAVWVEVIDARGDVRLRRNLGAGEKVECGGVLPLSVVLGRADSVDVEVRGKAFDFSQYSRENVAKFEVR